jgi:putative mycofactocin binding protein MftB
MNLSQPYQVAEGVAIRAERFGGLVYNYQNRHLYFLHSHELTELVRGLKGEQPLAAAIEAFHQSHALSPEAGEAMLKSLAALAKMGLIVPAAQAASPTGTLADGASHTN